MGFVGISEQAEAQGSHENATRTIRALVVDKHPLVRAGVRAELSKLSGTEVVGETNDGREAVELAKTLEPDIVVMGVTLAMLNGLEATARITRNSPGSRVLIFSRHDEEEYVWNAFKKGASGYLLKRAALDELTEGVRHVALGEMYLCRELAKHLFRRFCSEPMTQSDSALDHLTDRQCEILQLIAEGHNTKQIAALLGVCPKTVDFHRAKLMERLNIRDVAGLVRLAFREKLLDTE
jgi:DNA-binding NarL/FixJ family response regulator